MKKDELLKHASFENADAICAKIRQDADEEVSAIMEHARKDAEKSIEAARQQIARRRESALLEMERELVKIRERGVSIANLEKKRIALEGKSRFVDTVLAGVNRRAQEFRRADAYQDFLVNMAVEGIAVLDSADAQVYYSAADEAVFTEGFRKRVQAACSDRLKKSVQISFMKSDFKDLGVVVNSSDGRMSFDNRFLARLGRIKEQVYMELLKEVS